MTFDVWSLPLDLPTAEKITKASMDNPASEFWKI